MSESKQHLHVDLLVAARTIQLPPATREGCWGGLFGERLKDRCGTRAAEMAFGPGRKAPIAAANQHCRQKSATPSCLGAAAAMRVQSRCSSLPSSSATHASGQSQVQGRSVELRKCGSPVCREGAEMQEGQEKMQKSVAMQQ